MRYLVTTSDERTWSSDKPILFLGSWCLRWEKKNALKNIDFAVCPPFGMTQEMRDRDRQLELSLESKIFPDICNLLSQHHGKANDDRYWKIILGHWFKRYLRVMINRIGTMRHCLATQKLSGTTTLVGNMYSMSTNDSDSFIWATNNDRWNHELYSQILLRLSNCDVPVKKLIDTSNEIRFIKSDAKPHFSSLKNKIKKILNSMLDNVSMEGKIYFSNTYLPRKTDLLLQVFCKQIPALSRNVVPVPLTAIDHNLRSVLTSRIIRNECGEVERIVRDLLFDILPACYLESFSMIIENIKKKPFPKQVKVIFTSNSFDTDEHFKVWVAESVLRKTRYIVGQHGNNYGTHRYHANYSVEENTCDRFITWGWRGDLEQHIPGFIFKTAGRNKIKTDPRGNLLLVQTGVSHRIETWDVVYEYFSYLQDQTTLVGKLNSSVKSKLLVRLYPKNSADSHLEHLRWKEHGASIELEPGLKPIDSLLRRSRLVVYSYDSTGILENFARNIPTIAFWSNKLQHLRPSATPLYEVLISAKIIHLTPESAAEHINSVWDRVDEWWMSSTVVEAREAFTSVHARSIEHPIRFLAGLLMSRS